MEVYQSSKTAKELEFALGAVPSIGENNHWFIGDVDTGVSAEGLTPFIGENGNWWVGETDTGVYAGGVKVEGAEVGQIIVVKAVDENGVPTEWEAVDNTASSVPEIPQIDYTVEEEAVTVGFTEIDGVSLESKKFTSCYVRLTNAIQEATANSNLSVSVNPSNSLASTDPKANAQNFSKQTSKKAWSCYFDLERGFSFWMAAPSGNPGWSGNIAMMPNSTATTLGNCIRWILLRDSNGIPAGTNIKIWLR